MTKPPRMYVINEYNAHGNLTRQNILGPTLYPILVKPRKEMEKKNKLFIYKIERAWSD